MTKNRLFPRSLNFNSVLAAVAASMLALPAWAQSPYAGVYIGDLTNVAGTSVAGYFAIQVNDDSTAYAIFVDLFASGDGASTDAITVNTNGSFAFDLPHPNPDVQQPGRKVVGTFANNGVSGDVCDFTLNSGDPGCPGSGGDNPLVRRFSATRSSSTGPFAQIGGIYTGTITGSGMESGVFVTLDGPIVAIADALGQAVLLASPRMTLGSTPQGVLDMAVRTELDPSGQINLNLTGGGSITGTINFLINPPSGGGNWSAGGPGQQRNLSGDWSIARVYPLPSPPPDTDIDVTDISDISTDAVPDVAYLTTKNGQPFVRYYSGATRQKIRGQAYFGSAWMGIAAASAVDANADGMGNDPAVAVLAHKASAGRHEVEVRRADNGALINRLSFFAASWIVLDIAIIDDKNGDGVTGDTLVAVLGYNPAKPFDQQIKVQVIRLSDCVLVANWPFFNGNWVPVALAAVHRQGQTLLLAVLAIKPSTGANVIQARKLSNGAKQRDTSFFNAKKIARHVAILLDANGDGNANDPAYLVLANDIFTGKNKIQARRVSDGARQKNLTAVGTNWEAKRIMRSSDISGNLIQEVGALAKKLTDGKIAIVLKDYDDLSTTATIIP